MLLNFTKSSLNFFECPRCQSNELCLEHGEQRLSLKNVAPILKQHLIEGLDSYDLLNVRLINSDLHSYANREIQRRRFLKTACLCRTLTCENDSKEDIIMSHIRPVRWPFMTELSLNFNGFKRFLSYLAIERIHTKTPCPQIIELLETIRPKHWSLDFCPRDERDGQLINAVIKKLPSLETVEVMVSCDLLHYAHDPIRMELIGFEITDGGICCYRRVENDCD